MSFKLGHLLVENSPQPLKSRQERLQPHQLRELSVTLKPASLIAGYAPLRAGDKARLWCNSCEYMWEMWRTRANPP